MAHSNRRTKRALFKFMESLYHIQFGIMELCGTNGAKYEKPKYG